MKYSLRSLMIAVSVLPPLLAWGWLLLAWFMTPLEPVYPDQYRWMHANVSWEQAKAEVMAADIERLKEKNHSPTSQKPSPNRPQP